MNQLFQSRTFSARRVYTFASISALCIGMLSGCSEKAPSRSELQQAKSTQRRASAEESNRNGDQPAVRNNAAGQKVALVVVDVQHDFFEPQTEMANPNFVANLKSALASCRSSGIEVIHVRTAFSANPKERPKGFQKFFGAKIPCILGTPGVKALECARQAKGERVFYKNSFDPFDIPEFGEHLKENNIGHLLVCGLTTDVCVLSTCFSSTNKGFLTTLVEDCTASGNPMSHQFVINRYRDMIFDTVSSRGIEGRFTSGDPALMTSTPTTNDAYNGVKTRRQMKMRYPETKQQSPINAVR